MPRKTIAIASDHAGFDLKTTLMRDLKDAGYATVDLGTKDRESDQASDGESMSAALGR